MFKIENLLHMVQDEKSLQETLQKHLLKSRERLRVHEAALGRLRNPTTGIILDSSSKARVSEGNVLKSVTEGVGRRIRITPDNVFDEVSVGDTVLFEELGNKENGDGFETHVEYCVEQVDENDSSYPLRIENPRDSGHPWIELDTEPDKIKLYKIVK